MPRDFKQQIDKSFSRYAENYDEHAVLQKEHNERLLDLLSRELSVGSELIDAGCGTGYLLTRLAQFRPDLNLQGFDLSLGMLDSARKHGVNCREGDLESWPYEAKQADAAVSCFALHWAKHTDKVFQETARVLKPQGVFYYILPVRGTFQELDEIFCAVLGDYPQRHWFASVDQVLLAARQSDCHIINWKVSESISVYPDMGSLLGEIKNIGATAGRERLKLTRTKLERLAQAMLKQYGKYQLTYQVLSIYGKKL